MTSDVVRRRDALLQRLRALARPDAVQLLARFGIPAQEAFGIPAAELRRIAREIGRDHELAEALWQLPNLDVRGLACLLDDPALVDGDQMERWAASFDSWAVCDGAVMNLFRYSPLAPAKAKAWVAREEEFVRRAGFSLMASLAVSARTAPDAMFEEFLALLPANAGDPRPFVKKAAGWALRTIGKRRPLLRDRVVEIARALAASPSPAARWVGRDALKELVGKSGVPATR